MAYAPLISRWTLDEGAGTRKDVYGAAHPNNLTDNNAVGAMLGHGGVGGAALFTAASSQRLTILNASQQGLNPGLNDLSISFWLYPVGITGAGQFTIFSKGATGASPLTEGYGITICGTTHLRARQILAVFGDSIGAVPGGQAVFSNKIPLSAWSHLAFTFDRDGVIAGYLNGVQMSIQSGDFADISHYASSAGTCNPNAAFALGSFSANNAGGFGNYFDGGVQDFRSYRGLLELGEIKKLAGLAWQAAISTDELALHTARAGIILGSTGRAGGIVDSARLRPGTGEIIWDRAIDRTHVLTPYNQGQPPSAADQAVYTTTRE